jgi:hypothetical protein
VPDPSASLRLGPAPARPLHVRLLRAIIFAGTAVALFTFAWLAFEDAITVDLDAYEPVLTLQTPARGVCRLPSRPATLDHRPADLLEDI